MSSPVRIVEPVVVKPDTASNTASAPDDARRRGAAGGRVPAGRERALQLRQGLGAVVMAQERGDAPDLGAYERGDCDGRYLQGKRTRQASP